MPEELLGRIMYIHKGPYDNEETYDRLDLVTDEGARWICLVDDTSGVTPSSGEGVTWQKDFDYSTDAQTLDGLDSTAFMQKSEYELLLGTLSAPLFHAPLKNGLGLVHGVGSLAFSRVQVNPQSVTSVDRYGKVQYYDENDPRYEKEFVIEGDGTNLLIYSEQLDNAAWIKSGDSAVTTDGTLSSDGTKQMFKITSSDFSIGANAIYNTVSVTDTGQDIAYAFEVKAGDGTLAEIRTSATGGTTQDDKSVFNMSTGEWSLQNPNHKNFYVKALVGGRHRIGVVFTLNNTGNNTITARISGDDGTYIYSTFPQVEESPFATSYIPTTTTPATRNGDDLSAPFAGNMTDLNNEYTVFTDIRFAGYTTYNQWFFEINDSAGRVRLQISSTGVLACYVGAVVAATSTNTVITDFDKVYRIGLTHDGNGTYTLFLDGVDVTDSRNSISIVFNNDASVIKFQSATATSCYGNISNIRICDKARTEAQMRVA